MNLDTPTKILQIVLGEAKTTNDCPITTSYFDSVPGGFNLLNHNVLSNGVTVVTAVAAPGPNVERQVKEVRLVNTDTVSHLVTLQLFDGTNTWIIQSQTIAVNGLFLYTPEGGTATVPTGGGGGGSLTVEDDTGDTIASVSTLQFEAVIVSGSSPSAIVNMATIETSRGSGSTPPENINIQAGGGSPALSPAFGGYARISGGSGGYGSGSTYGGGVRATGGAGGSGTTYAAGGSLILEGGPGGVGAANGPGGGVYFQAGNGYGSGAGGDMFFLSGNASGGAGGGAQFNLGAGTPAGKIGINGDPSLIVAAYSWTAGAQLNNQTIFTTTRAMVVTAVIGRPDAVNGTAATLVIVKASSGTAPSVGTPLTSTSMDLTGAANINQTLTLSATLADITLAPGDSLCMTTSGTLAASAGCITVWGTPQ